MRRKSTLIHRAARRWQLLRDRAALAAAAAHRALMRRDHYTEERVLCSAAGWYIGTLFWDSEYQFYCPGSRDSDYFATKEDAELTLRAVQALDRW